MAINQNHLFEDLNGVKCAIVEKNVLPARVEFLKSILEYNRYTVVVTPSPPPKTPPAKPAAGPTSPTGGIPSLPATTEPPPPPPPETFTVGVTDVGFNPINAIFGRLLTAPGGHTVTLAYWQQKDKESRDEIPYFSRNS